MRNSLLSLPCLAVAIVVSIAAVGSSKAQTAAPAFDGFLAGITECSFSKDYENFRNGVVARFANENGATTPLVNKTATVPVPAALSGAIDIEGARVRSEDGGQSTSVDIPAQGSFNGLPLKNLIFVLGNENGIFLVGVEFAAPRDEVIKTVQQSDQARQRAAEEEFGRNSKCQSASASRPPPRSIATSRTKSNGFQAARPNTRQASGLGPPAARRA